MIERNINRKYFSDKKLEDFFDLCFSVKNLNLLKNDPRFVQFIEYDLKFIIQSLRQVDHIVGFSKFLVFFRIEDDPEVYEILADQVKRSLARFTTDELLTILINFSHSLSTESQDLFSLANDEFANRLDSNFNAVSREAYIQKEDFPKIVNVMLDHKKMD